MNSMQSTVAAVLAAGAITFVSSYFFFVARSAPPVNPRPDDERIDARTSIQDQAKEAIRKPEGAAPAVAHGGNRTNKPRAYVLPANGGVWPWPIGVPSEPTAAVPVPLTQFVDRSHSVRGAAVNPVAGKAIVVVWETNFKEKTRATHLLWADLRSGAVTHRWKINETLYAPFDLHVGGRHFLLRNHGGNSRDRDVVELCSINAAGQLQRRPWRPSQASVSLSSRRGGDDVRWAGFVGRDHLATVCGDGSLAVWKFPGLQLVGGFADVKGYPTVTPDGQRLAFATGNHVALLDPPSGQVLGERNVGSVPDDAVLAFHPENTMLACGGSGRVVLLDLNRGQVWNAMIPDLQIKPTGLLPDFGWAGDRHFYLNGLLYDLYTPIPIWRYIGPRWASPRGRELWTVTQPYGDKATVLRSFRLPHRTVAVRYAEALRKPGLFALRPGDSVRIDVSNLPRDRQPEIRDVLQLRIQKQGYRLSSSAPIVFQASVDEQPTERRITYQFGGRSEVCPYQQRQAHLKILRGTQVLWSSSSSKQPPFLISVSRGTDVQAYVRNHFGAPNYKLYSERPLPGVIRGDRSKSVFGNSDLAASGIRDKGY